MVGGRPGPRKRRSPRRFARPAGCTGPCRDRPLAARRSPYDAYKASRPASSTGSAANRASWPLLPSRRPGSSMAALADAWAIERHCQGPGAGESDAGQPHGAPATSFEFSVKAPCTPAGYPRGSRSWRSSVYAVLLDVAKPDVRLQSEEHCKKVSLYMRRGGSAVDLDRVNDHLLGGSPARPGARGHVGTAHWRPGEAPTMPTRPLGRHRAPGRRRTDGAGRCRLHGGPAAPWPRWQMPGRSRGTA